MTTLVGLFLIVPSLFKVQVPAHCGKNTELDSYEG